MRLWLLVCLAGLPSLAAQDRTGVVLVAHGADSAWNAPVEALAGALGGPDRVRVAFLMGSAASTHRFQDAVAALRDGGASRVVVVPLLVSSRSGHYRQLEWLVGRRAVLDGPMRDHLAHAGIEPVSSEGVTLLPALDAAPEMSEVLADRVRAILGDRPAQGRAVFLVGHGPNAVEDHAAWMAAFRAQAERLRVALGLDDVRAGVVRDDAAPAVRAEAVMAIRDVVTLQARATGHPVLVVPVLISSSSLNRRRLPEDLADLPIEYVPTPLLPHPAMIRWVARVVETVTVSMEGNTPRH